MTGRITDHGGNVATALVAVARLGGRAGFIGWLNDQPLDDRQRPRARAARGRHVASRRGAPTPGPSARSSRSAPDGERFIAYDDDVPHGTSETLADDTLAQRQVLLIDGYATRSLGCRRPGARAGSGGGGRHRMDDRAGDGPVDALWPITWSCPSDSRRPITAESDRRGDPAQASGRMTAPPWF